MVRSSLVLWKVMEQSDRNLAEAVEGVVTPEEILLERGAEKECSWSFASKWARDGQVLGDVGCHLSRSCAMSRYMSH